MPQSVKRRETAGGGIQNLDYDAYFLRENLGAVKVRVVVCLRWL